MTLLDRMREATRAGGVISIVGRDGAETRSHGRILSDAEALARGLVHHGVRPGDRLAIEMRTSFDAISALVATWLAGAVPVVLPPPPRVGSRRAFDARTAALLRATGAAPLPEVTPRSSGSLAEPDDDDEALVSVTSGSTGEPRPVVKRHRALEAHATQHRAAKGGLTPGVDRRVGWMPLHRRALRSDVLYPLAFGADAVLLPVERFSADPLQWLHTIDRTRGTYSSAPTFAYRLLANRLDALPDGALDLSSWRTAHCSGEMIDVASLAHFAAAARRFGFDPAALCPSYGLSEVGGVASRRGLRVDVVDPGELALGRAVPVDGGRAVLSMGRAVPGVGIRIVDAASAVVPDRTVGRILVRSAAAMEGSAGSHHDTGDLGYIADDELYVLGRSDDMMIVRGRNVHPGDVEAAVLAIDAVHIAVAFASGDEIVVSVHGDAVDHRAVARAVWDAVSLRVTVDVRRLPPQPAGKTPRHAVREEYERAIAARRPTPTDG